MRKFIDAIVGMWIIGLTLLLCLAIGGGCGENARNLKYKKGDVVYLKPDSTKGVIEEVERGHSDYQVTIGYEDGAFTTNVVYVDEEIIYENPQNR